jgi:tetratricopeptide (TPR) repeat protein
MQALKRGELLAYQFKLNDASIIADVNKARLYISMGDIGLAQKRISRALEQIDLDSVLAHGTPAQRIVARRVAGTAGILSKLQQDYVREKKWFEHELKLRHSTGENPTPTLWALASVSLKFDNVASAEKYLVQTMTSAGKKDKPWINYVWAEVAEKRGELSEARHLCILALEQFTRLGHKVGVQECQELLTRLNASIEPNNDTQSK